MADLSLSPGQRPVGVLDSGVGGLSVLREVRQQLPAEELLYFADQAHIPYGPRPLDEIRAFTQEITRFLLARGAKLVVVACNTASAAALRPLRERFRQVPFVGMEPAVKPAAQRSQSGVVGVLATPATFQGALFASLRDRYAGDVQLLEQICPGLVEQVEAGELEGIKTETLLRRYLAPLLAQKADTLVLGCTHYPFLAPTIQRLAGAKVAVIDPGPAVARQTGRVLAQRGWLNPGPGLGSLTAYTSGDPAAFQALAGQLLGETPAVQAVAWRGPRLEVPDPGA